MHINTKKDKRREWEVECIKFKGVNVIGIWEWWYGCRNDSISLVW